MNFAHPDILYLLLLTPAAAAFLIVVRYRTGQALARFGNPALLERAGLAVSNRMRFLKSSFLLVALALLIFCLAGPQWGASFEKIERKGVDVVVALDTSHSMNATDAAPSRLLLSKEAIKRLTDLMKGDRVGIVVFAGSAFTMCPLTLDYDAARMFLDVIDTEIVPDPGTDIPAALAEAAQNFDDDTNKYKVLILISDGENLESEGGINPDEVAQELNKKGVRIFTVGVGSSKGSSIPQETPGGVIDRSRKGEIIITRLDENTLRKIALAGDGKYRRLDNSSTKDELADIYADIAGMEKKKFEEEYQIHFQDRFQWFAGVALLLLALEPLVPDRRRRKS